MKDFIYEAYGNLRIAILQQAVEDYRKAIKKTQSTDKYEKRQGTYTKNSLERFFLSEWGELLSGDNGQFIVDKLREEMQQDETI